MTESAGTADLHLHTTASDGTCSVRSRIEQAVARDLDAIAITDHDCIDETLTGRRESADGVEVITGVEVRGDVSNTKIELLGYYVDPATRALQNVLDRARAHRRDRNRAMVDALVDSTGIAVTYEELSGDVDGMLGRPHLAEVLVDAGVVDSIGKAFDRYLGTGGSAFVPMERVDAAEIIDAIHAAGGVASLAHPGRIRTADVRPLVHALVDAGLDAIEVWYPYDAAPQSPDYAPVGVPEADAIATDGGLLRTGGSDCHGPDSGKFRIGDVRVPSSALDALKAAAADRLAF